MISAGMAVALALQAASTPPDLLVQEGAGIGRMVVLGVRCEADGRLISDPVGQSLLAESLDDRAAASGADPSAFVEAIDRGMEAAEKAISAAEVEGVSDQYFEQACSDLAQQFPLSFRLPSDPPDRRARRTSGEG